MALIFAAVVVGQYFLYDRIGLKKVSYKLSISVSEAFENDVIEIVEEIENAKRLPLVWVRSEISCSPWLSFEQTGQNVENRQRGLISGIFMLRGYRKCRRTWRVRCEKRGLMTVDNVVITSSDLFGLSKKAKIFKVTDTVRVLPLPADMDEGGVSGDMFIGNTRVKRFVLPDPFMINGAREYTGREPMNRIHWAQTARTGSLMAYRNEFSTERRVMVILNMQRYAGEHRRQLPISVLESQIKAAAFALDRYGGYGTECALAVNGAKRRFVPAAAGYAHIMEALRLLAELENECGEHINELFESLDFSGYTDVVLITACVTERVCETLSGLSDGGKRCKLFTTGLDNGAENVPQSCEILHIPHEKYRENG